MARDPTQGETLRGELAELWKYRGKRFRIVYGIDRPRRTLRVFAVGHRRGIYEAVAELLRGGL